VRAARRDEKPKNKIESIEKRMLGETAQKKQRICAEMKKEESPA
jgi:hypothetical protein